MDYRDTGINTYGNKCELCGYGIVQVHHISYQEQQLLEGKIRLAVKNKLSISGLLEEAKKQGYLWWNDNQLAKDDRSTNLSVLCPNCHTMVHTMDVGKKLLKMLPERR